MADDVKPRVAEGYRSDVTVACERTLLTLYGAFGSLKTSLRLVGGLVPRYLTPASPPEVPHHAGTSDVDVVLNLQIIAQGEGYASLSKQLLHRGFARYVDARGVASSWRWTRQVDDTHHVMIEFLRDAGTVQPGRAVSVDGERVSALTVKFAGITHDWFEEQIVSGLLLEGGGMSSERIRYADVPAFVILKALALDDRHENKDAADIVHVLRYAGPIEAVVELFVNRISSGDHPAAVDAGLDALRRRFCDDHLGKGHLKLGPIAYARFHHAYDEDACVRAQRYAAGLVHALLAGIAQRVS